MIAPTCAYSCRHDCAYLARALVGMKILRVPDKTKRDQLEKHDSDVCKHVDEVLRSLVWQKGRHKVRVLMATSRCSHVFSKDSKETTMQKPGNNAKALGSIHVVHKRREQNVWPLVYMQSAKTSTIHPSCWAQGLGVHGHNQTSPCTHHALEWAAQALL
jgi:hypothetical protein